MKIWLILITCLVLIITASARADDTTLRQRFQQIQSYYCFYGQGHVDELKHFDAVIMHEPERDITPEKLQQHHDEVRRLNQAGVITVGYITLGEDFPVRKADGKGPGGMASWYYDNDHDGKPDTHPVWKSAFCNTNSAAFRADRIAEAKRLVNDLGYQGIFLDTIDHVDRDPDVTDAMVGLIHDLRQALGDDKVIVANRGFTILPRIAPDIDGMMFEYFSTWHDWNATGRDAYRAMSPQDMDARLDEVNFKIKPALKVAPFKVLVLDYCRPDQQDLIKLIYDRAAAFGFLPCAAPVSLDDVYHVTYEGKPDPKYLHQQSTPQMLIYTLPEPRNGFPAGTQIAPSSCFGGYTAAPVVDGIRDRTSLDWQVADWASAERPTDHWLEIRLPEPVEGGAFHLTWSLPSRQYELQYKAPDSDTWQRLAEEKQNTESQHAYPLPDTPITVLRIHQPAHQGNEKRPDLMWVQQVSYQAN